jgi:hypothetical protein
VFVIVKSAVVSVGPRKPQQKVYYIPGKKAEEYPAFFDVKAASAFIAKRPTEKLEIMALVADLPADEESAEAPVEGGKE